MPPDLADTLAALHADAFGWALHCCRGDAERAADVLQAAYLKVVDRSAGPASAVAAVKPWWFGVIRLTALEEHRRARTRDSLLARLWAAATGDGRDGAPSPPARVELDEEGERLRRCLSELSPRQAEVLHLVFYQGLTVTEAAGVMGVGVGSARQHYDRGKARLRELLSAEVSHA